jgi:hypothetical protein
MNLFHAAMIANAATIVPGVLLFGNTMRGACQAEAE